ncbi:MAG: phage head-tail connector protein, partial [Spirochaetota bacterium]
TTLTQVKTILQISGTEQDELIEELIPLVEEQYLEIRNLPFETDSEGNTIYPAGSALTAAQMVGYQLQARQNATGKTSESLGDYSYTMGAVDGGYPDSITMQIRRYVGTA